LFYTVVKLGILLRRKNRHWKCFTGHTDLTEMKYQRKWENYMSFTNCTIYPSLTVNQSQSTGCAVHIAWMVN